MASLVIVLCTPDPFIDNLFKSLCLLCVLGEKNYLYIGLVRVPSLLVGLQPKLWQQGETSFVITANTVICPLPSCMPDITITKYYFPT